MAGVAIRVDVRNQAALVLIDRLVRRLEDPQQALGAGGVHMLHSIQKNFDEGGRPERWRPWAVSTALGEASGLRLKSGRITSSARRTAKARTGKVLVDHGHLMSSIRMEATGTALTLSSNLVYARIHQLGGQAGRRSARVTIPARPYLVFQDPEDLTTIAALLKTFYAEGGR